MKTMRYEKEGTTGYVYSEPVEWAWLDDIFEEVIMEIWLETGEDPKVHRVYSLSEKIWKDAGDFMDPGDLSQVNIFSKFHWALKEE